MNCPVCQASSRRTHIEVTTTQPFWVERCPDCALRFTVPRPTTEELANFYIGDYFNSRVEGLGYKDYSGESLAAANAERMWSLLQRWDPQLAEVPHALLDVGCASGEFAKAALRDGWTASGVEPAEEARQKASAKGITTFSSLEGTVGPFGLITMLHVLEHLIDPLSALIEARGLIAEGGLLLIELPQWGSLGRRVRKANWSQLRPPEHINFFTTRSLSLALRHAGWRVLRAQTIYEHLINKAAEALRYRRLARAIGYGLAGTSLERLHLGGYLRAVAAPVEVALQSESSIGRRYGELA